LWYFKDLFNGNSNLGINIYQGNNNFDELSDLLSKKIFLLYPLKYLTFNKINYILINKWMISDTSMINFTSKPISLIWYFTPNTIRCNTKCLWALLMTFIKKNNLFCFLKEFKF